MVQLSTGANSKQNYQTPPDFMDAVKQRFGPIAFDLAADETNKQAERFYSIDDDSLSQDWVSLSWELPQYSVIWLNPPFKNIPLWAKKCAESGPRLAPDRVLLLLTPASVGSNWFRDHVVSVGHSLLLNGRITFVGETHPFPKDCQLAVYSRECNTGISIWKWR